MSDETKKYNGKLYYKDPQKYYGPENTYKDIPNMEPDKFYVNYLLMFFLIYFIFIK